MSRHLWCLSQTSMVFTLSSIHLFESSFRSACEFFLKIVKIIIFGYFRSIDSSGMGNPNTKLSVDGRFEAGVLNCRHSPRIELRLPDHPECQSCCKLLYCETHDPTHPEMMNFKRIVQNFLEPQAATASSSTAEEVAERGIKLGCFYIVRRLIGSF